MSCSPKNPTSQQSSKSVTKRPRVQVNPNNFKLRLDYELRLLKGRSPEARVYKLVGVEADQRRWVVRFLPDKPPYDASSYRCVLEFPPEYPFKPPSVHFATRIYHPQVDEKGKIELPMCHSDAWKPCVQVVQVCDALATTITHPSPNRALRKEVAEQMLKSRDEFMTHAASMAKSDGEPRA